jgi:hypothetical protein
MRSNPWLKASAALTALVAFALLVGVGTGRAATSFLLTGSIESIDEGDVDAAGNSGRFVVKDRHVGGHLSGMIGGQLLTNVPFEFTFGTNVPLMTQSGNLHGVLSFAGFEARVAGKTQLGLTPIACDPRTTPGCVPVPGGGGFLPGLLLSGTLTFTHGTTGHGTIDGFLVPILDAEGHIVAAFGQVTLRSS